MMRKTTLWSKAVAGLLCLLVALCGATAQGQAISNTAYASWPVGGQTATAASNTVTITKEIIPVTVETFLASQNGSSVLTFQAPQCKATASSVASPLALSARASPAGMASTTVIPATAVSIGEAFYFTVSMPQANLGPAAIDHITVIITTTSGDNEVLVVSETAANTGLFAGSIATAAIPPQPVHGDCVLSVGKGDTITIQPEFPGNIIAPATATITVLADPAGEVFSSDDGTPVNGATVTIIDTATGQPATVYGADGATLWPSTMLSGQPVTDGAGVVHIMDAGMYSFPKVAIGSYRIDIKPPSPYTAPSRLSPAQLTGLKRSDGSALNIGPASYGAGFTLARNEPVQIDIPVDHPVSPARITKIASISQAQPGDLVVYTVTVTNPDRAHAMRGVTLVDLPSPLLRLRKGSVRIDGVPAGANAVFSPDGTSLTLALGTLPHGATHVVTYAASVRAAAGSDRAENTATVTDVTGTSASASALVRIIEDGLTARMTLVGEITDHGCAWFGPHRGVPGVRVMLEDGSFAITDANGRYHFDGLVPGSHVVQVAGETLPDGGQFVACGGGTRAAGSAISRFVVGQGGSLLVANFHAVLPASAMAAPPADAGKGDVAGESDRARDDHARDRDRNRAERLAAGADTDWLAQGNGPPAILFPAPDHNPRSPAIRVVIRHAMGQVVNLFANGKPVSQLMRDTDDVPADHSFAVSIWRGVPLDGETTELSADVRNADGSLAAHLARPVHFNNVPFSAQIVPERTMLIADGRTRPVVAVRVVDRNGRPVHAGLLGDLAISAPYESADSVDMMQARALSGLGRQTPHWTVRGDDGVALIELAPTMASGALQLNFAFVDNDQRHALALEGWVKPGKVDWTLIGLAEGSIGARMIADNMEKSGRISSDLGQHARAAFYAKGRVLGKFLLTMAYDSAKQASDQTVMGTIDPRAYYTVYGDGSSRRFDAASRNKLYVRVETATFYAIFGDVEAGFNQTKLAQFHRTATGLKSEANLAVGQAGKVHLQGFAARTSTTHRHDEIAGNGLSGPYPLSSNAILMNTQMVTIEVRDHTRPDVVLSSTPLTPWADYTIDPLSGTITFKQPLLARDGGLNPQYAVIDYDIDATLAGANSFVGAGRADFTTRDKRLRVGTTVITDTAQMGGTTARSSEVAADLKLLITPTTELRAEGGISTMAGMVSRAWLIEQEHHDRLLDVLAYVRSADRNFGVGQTGDTQLGHRRAGIDARRKLNDKLALSGSVWIDNGLGIIDNRKQAAFKLQYRDKATQVTLGMTTLSQHDGTGSGNSTTIDAGVTRKFLNNRLELSAGTAIPLGSAAAASLPGSVTFGARYALNSHTRLVGSYELANSSALRTRTGRVGIDAQPWQGGHLTAGVGQQDIVENAQRSFAAFGLSQSFALNRHLTVDATVDTNKVLSGGSLAGLSSAVTGLSGASSSMLTGGGAVGTSTTGSFTGSGIATTSLIENYTAVTLGLAWRKDLWSATMRGEWRNGELSRRHGLTAGAIRQLGDGKMLGSGLTWTHAVGTTGAITDVFDATVALAWRPHFAPWAWLARAEYRSDYALAGKTGTGSTVPSLATAGAGSGFSGLANGDAHARRLIVSASADWTPRGRQDDEFVERSEVSLFAAVRRNFDAYDGYNLSGTTLMAGVTAHIGLGERLEIGGAASVITNPTDHTTHYSIGPSIGFVPAKNVLMMIGYNLKGYHDADFSAANATTKGVFATLRMKFDTSTFGFLGLDNKVRAPVR
ncbi:hypothetical protein [Novosphingobium sp.]|uniref:hypothetical protein n=1 Tax=Novosphingobium sp. TaxID=1874826 RepID=UPI0033407FF5